MEEKFLADSLKGHITYFRTMYRPKTRMDKRDNYYTGIMNIKYNNKIIFESPNQYRNKNNHIYNEEVLQNQIESANANAVYYKDFREYLEIFINMDIKCTLENKNPVFRMLALLDRRVGKRTLFKLVKLYQNEPEWLQEIYKIRFDSEKIFI